VEYRANTIALPSVTPIFKAAWTPSFVQTVETYRMVSAVASARALESPGLTLASCRRSRRRAKIVSESVTPRRPEYEASLKESRRGRMAVVRKPWIAPLWAKR
jgi:hypothetical protein